MSGGINRHRLTAAELGTVAAGAAVAASLSSITASQILLGIAILLTFQRWTKARYPRAFWCVPVFVALTLISTLAGSSFPLALPYLKKFFVFLIIPCLAASITEMPQVRRLVLAVGVVGLISAGWGLVQYMRKYLAITGSGQDFSQSYVADRITGFMSHWMTFGGGMMVIFLLAGACVFFTTYRRYQVALAMGVVASAIALGETRSIWIGSFAGGVYLLWSYRPVMVVVAPVVAVLGTAVAPRSVADRALSIVRPRGDMDSNAHRIALLRTGARMIMAHPLLGVGPGKVPLEFAQYAPEDIPRPFPASWYLGHLHNIYIQYAAERGIPAMLVFVGFLIWSCCRIARVARLASDGSGWIFHGVAAAILGILVSGMFEHNMGDSEILLLVLGLLTVCVCVRPRMEHGGSGAR